jgi:hypothetical protein
MSIRLRAPLRGLLTGVFVLIAFAFTTVSMTAGGSRAVIGGLRRPLTAQAVVPIAASPTASAPTASGGSAAPTSAGRADTASAGDEANRRDAGGHHR